MGIAYTHGTEAGNVTIDHATCGVCGSCVRVCPCGCFSSIDGHIKVDANAGIGCIACGQCMMVCPSRSVQVTGRGMEKSTLVDLPPRTQQANTEQMENLLLARRSVRHFTEQDVATADLERIVRAAALGPMGFPPSEVGVVILQGREKVRQLAQDGVNAYRPLVKYLDNWPLRFLARLLLPKTKYQWMFHGIIPLGRALLEQQRQGRDAALYDAPAALLFHSSPFGEGADPHIACTCAMLQAQAMGLGTTMIGAVPGPLATRKDILRKYHIPAGHRLQLVLILGHPAVGYRRAIRRQLGWVSTWQSPTAS